MGDITPIDRPDDASQGLTPIHRRIHCAATPDTDSPEYTEAERVMVDNFLNTLAEIALAVATRNAKGQDEEPDRTHPLLLTGYGAYGIPASPGFSHQIPSLLDRGFIVAEAHIRGGDDLGRRWYEEGRLHKKKNSFDDFIACSRHLIGEGFTSHDKLVIRGGSAGGLLVAAAANKAPDLYRAVVAEVPFVDVVNSMLDPDLPLTLLEYEEWGNPETTAGGHSSARRNARPATCCSSLCVSDNGWYCERSAARPRH